MNSVLSLKRIKITSFRTYAYGNCFEQKRVLHDDLYCPAGVFLNTSNQDSGEKKHIYDPMCLNNEFVAGLNSLVPAYLSRSHSLHYAHAWSAVAALSVDAIFVN